MVEAALRYREIIKEGRVLDGACRVEEAAADLDEALRDLDEAK